MGKISKNNSAACGRQGSRQNWNVHQLLQRLKNVDILDGVSQNSAEEGSNTDSGRGPSEPDAVAAGGTAEYNGNGTKQCPSTLYGPTDNASRTTPANHYG